jgi:hypothetical protein
VRSESNDRVIVCGGAPAPNSCQQQKVTALFINGPRTNVNLRVDDISKRIAANLADYLVDLIEIAAYVYSADQAATRGGDGVQNVGKFWRRHFHFFIPVREPTLWMRSDVYEALTTALGFLSEDTYDFTFSPLVDPIPMERYLEGTIERWDVDEVMLFSGGLDSLGGAVQQSLVNGRRVALVSHRSTPKMDTPQRRLASDLSSRCKENVPLHVPVWVNKDRALGVEDTQRTRSFLFAALGMVVARMFGLKNVSYYENGVTSLNLPISEQLVGAKASRTTHPQALRGLARFFGALLQDDFGVENPFIWNTKADIVNLIGAAGCEDLIARTVSCIHTIARTTEHTHCGLCSQCVGRRFATLASDFGDADPRERYKVDLLTGGRQDKRDVTLLDSVIRTARAMANMTDREFFTRFGEASRVINHLSGTAHEVGTRIWDLHSRYASEITRVLARGLREHADDFHAGRLPETCAVALAVPAKYKTASTPQLDESPELNGAEGPRMTLSREDQRLLRIVGDDLLRTMSTAEILRRTSLMRQFDPAFNGNTPGAIRSRLNRIRKKLGIPAPRLTKKTGQREAANRSKANQTPSR